jgi:phospholipid/cholesterol/gamma-HCH transport system substrate-binding protein
VKRDHINYTVVGVFVLIMGAAFLALLYKLTGSSGPADHYTVHYDNVFGLKYGTGVFYEGFQVGQIENIEMDRGAGHKRYKVELSVKAGWKIPDDSVAAIISSGLLSGVAINIQEGKSTAMLNPDAEINGADQVNLFAALNDVAKDFHNLSEEGLKPTIKNLNERISALAQEYEDLSKTDLRPLLESARRRVDDPELFDELKSILKKVDDSAARLQRLLGDKNQQAVTSTLTNVEKVSENTLDLLNRIEITRLQMHHAFGELDQLVTDNRGKVDQTLSDTAASADDLRASMQSLRQSLDTISHNLDTILYHLEGSSRDMHEFARQLRENPGLLLNSSPQEDKVKDRAEAKADLSRERQKKPEQPEQAPEQKKGTP